MDRVAAAFGLRGVLIPHEHRTSPTWRLETSAGAYLVKQVEVDGREAAVARAASFERAVGDAGVRVPRPEVDARAAEQIRGLPAFARELRHLASTVSAHI